MKYLKVMFKNKGTNFVYTIDEVNIAPVWNPNADNPKDFGGFNFSDREHILRWLHRGDTLYDVIVPSDAEVIDVIESATPHGVFRSNKIIITNPRIVTDEIAIDSYNKAKIPEKAYPKALAAVSVMNYKNTAYAILKDKVNKNNIDFVLEEWNDFINHKGSNDRKNQLVLEIEEKLKEIKLK